MPRERNLTKRDETQPGFFNLQPTHHSIVLPRELTKVAAGLLLATRLAHAMTAEFPLRHASQDVCQKRHKRADGGRTPGLAVPAEPAIVDEHESLRTSPFHESLVSRPARRRHTQRPDGSCSRCLFAQAQHRQANQAESCEALAPNRTIQDHHPQLPKHGEDPAAKQRILRPRYVTAVHPPKACDKSQDTKAPQTHA